MARKTLLTVDGFHNKVKKQLMTIDGVYRNVAKAYLTNDQGIWQQVWLCYTWRRYRVDSVPMFVWDKWSTEVNSRYTGGVDVATISGRRTVSWNPYSLSDDPPRIETPEWSWRTASMRRNWSQVKTGWVVQDDSYSYPCYYVAAVEEITNDGATFTYSKVARPEAIPRNTEQATYYGQVKSADSEAYPTSGEVGGYVYVYKTTTVEDFRGELVDIVTGDSPNAYPADGIHTDGYWYVLEVEPDGPQLYTADGLPVYTADGLPVYLRR